MFRQFLFAGSVMACFFCALTGCNKNPAAVEKDSDPIAPAGSTLLFADGFGGDLSKWEGVYMVSSAEKYKQMRIATAAAHSGTHSITTDSSMTALYHQELADNRVESGIAGVEFYMMAQSLSKVNFGVEIGQNPGSSGAVSPAFGIFFDPSDSIKCTVFMSWPTVDSQVTFGKIQAEKWYKCKVEVNFTDSTSNYYIDDAKILEIKLKDAFPQGVDRLLIFRGLYGMNFSTSADGVKPYYVDDIVFYKK